MLRSWSAGVRLAQPRQDPCLDWPRVKIEWAESTGTAYPQIDWKDRTESMFAHSIEFLELFNGQVQYVVPRWQRRYCWGQADIERLVEDLLTVANAGTDATHYAGNLLTFPDPGAAGVVKTIRVVDGQQRLTTVSILLGCIAEKLGPTGRCGDWTAAIIRNDRLTNPGKHPDKLRKLRLQDGDEEEYRLGLTGSPSGNGAVTKAWRIARRLVSGSDAAKLLEGLERLRVVSIGLATGDDPQQIFESLNATGRPLAESEKVKNWLLMGLRDGEQQDLHDNHWKRIEHSLGAEHTTGPTDIFFRDVLRWWTGKVQGIDHVYEALRRWALRTGLAVGRPALCRELARLAELYGIVTGTAGAHPNVRVERELRHLRDMGIDIHRPLTLRLLHDSGKPTSSGVKMDDLATALSGIATWTTRLWLAGRATNGMNRAIVDLAHGPGPDAGDEAAEYWLDRIRRLRNTRVAIPNDKEVREGLRTRKAYGGTATRSARAVLCALMEAEHREEAPARDHLTIEHVMPQALTDAWKSALGADAEEIHGRYRNRLANLTLSGDITNSEMGTDTFDAKRKAYRRSSIGLTRRIADEVGWDEDAMKRRAEDLAGLALDRWPWQDGAGSARRAWSASESLRWRVGNGAWHEETSASQMLLSVAGALLSLDSRNAERLSGEAISSNLHLAERYPPGTKAGTQTMRAVPGHEEYVLYPYRQDYRASAEHCWNMGERCGVVVEVEFEMKNRAKNFWKFLREEFGGVSGQKDSWRGPSQRTDPFNAYGDMIGIYVGNPESLWLYVKSGESKASDERAARMRKYSWMIFEQMGDQDVHDNIEQNSAKGWSVSVTRRWARDDEDSWPEAAKWLIEQCKRLRALAAAAGIRAEDGR